MKKFLAAFVVLFSLALPASASNVGNLSTMGAPADATYTFLTNPGNYFSIVGTEIVANPATPSGQYSIVVQATGGGLARPVKRTFALNYTSAIPPPVPGVFSIGINLVGAEAQFPSFATTAQINYHANRLHGSLNPVPKFRFTLGWSKVNTLGQTVGIQPVAFGPLDTTSTLYGGTSYVGAMNRVISDVMAAGGQVLLDIHEFGNAPGATTVGSAGCPFSCFADLWGKIADYYVHVRPDLLPGIYGLDLMNEWKFIDFAIAFNGNQAAITAARASGYVGPIYAEGVNFTSAWNWTTGDGQAFDNSNMYQLVDPLNNLISSAHMYPDPDDSGSLGAQTFAYSVALTVPGSAPTGLNVNPTIAVSRIEREWQPWTVQHSLRPHLGEYGTSNDNPWIGGAFDYADWNTITRNMLTFLRNNKIEISLWASGNGGAGYGPSGYGYSLDPFNSNLSGAYDFTATGVQEPVWTVIDDFTGYSGAQPTAYALFKPGLSTPNLYTTVGSPSAPFTIYYGGKITSSTIITPHDTLLDGTAGGGTFTPATITLANGDNATATFTYTPSQAATFKISTTNNRGWTDPPLIGFSSQGATDPYVTTNYTSLSNMYGMYNRFTPNTGPSLKLQRTSDNQQLDWGFTLLGNGYAQFDRGAIQTWASARRGIPITTIHSIGPIGNDITCTGTLPTLDLQNSAGYPEIVVPAGASCEFNIPIPGATALSTIARMNQAVGGAFFRQDWFTGPIILLNGNFQIFSTGCLPNGTVGGVGQGAVNTSLSLGVVNGQYHDYGASYASGATNGFVTYKDGTQVAQATVTYQLATCFASQQIEFVHFKNGPQPWSGSFTNFELVPGVNYTPSQQTAIATMDTTYYSTALPDVLPAINPTISGTGASNAVVGLTSTPFSGISVADANTGTPTDSVVITGTGTAGGTLTGTGLTGTGPWTMATAVPGTITSQMRALTYTPAGAIGTNETFTIAVTSSAGTSASDNHSVVTVIAPPPPVIASVLTNLPIYPGFIPARPFGGISVTDPNAGSPTETITITLSGAAGTLAGSGISGTGPYTVGPDTPGNVTGILNSATFTTAAGVGSVTNFALNVVSSAGSSVSNSATNTTVSTYSAQASFTPPGGTFTPVNHSGYNLAGGELNIGLQPAPAQMDYIANKGFGLFRYVMTSKYLYTAPFGQFDATYLAQIKAVIDYAYTKNLYVVIDPHDSGFVWDATFSRLALTRPSTRGQDLFQDEWRRISTAFLNYPNVLFGLNNEPSGQTAVQWRDGGVTPSVTAIRATGATQMILIPGAGDGSNNWTAQGNTAAFAGYAGDPLNNFAFEAHQYLDSSTSGGGSVATVNGSTILNDFNSFLTTNGFKGFLGEFGMAPDPFLCNGSDTLHYTGGTPVTTNSITQNNNMLSVMVSSGLYMGWAAWGGGYEFATPPTTNGYAFNPEPPRNGFNYVIPIIDQPQIAPLLAKVIP